jgi:hypothetical protein
MQTVHKYPIEIIAEQEISMPFGAKVIHAGLDPQGNPCVWAEVESTNTPEPVRLFVVGTGHTMPDEAATHVGSFVHDSFFMWHVFLG